LEFKTGVLTDPVALVPILHQTPKIALLYKDEGRLRVTYLLDLNYDQLGGLAAVEDAIQGLKPDDTKTDETELQGLEPGGSAVDEALQEPESEEEPPVKSAPADEKESWWSILFGMLGKALPHLGRALLHLVVLVIGSLLIFTLAAGIAGGESYSLPFDQVFIVTILGTGLSPFFGWTSTGIVLAIYAILCTALALYERFQRI
jgi:hypothetical protein